MWNLYFFDRQSSLRQEFDVTRFYLDYYKSILVGKNISQEEHEILSNKILRSEAILLDSNNQISYNAFVDNLRKQYIKEPVSKTTMSNNKKKHSRLKTKT